MKDRRGGRVPERWLRLAVVAAILAAGSLGILLLLADAARGDRHPGANVILISIDTLRADHLGCYGYAPPTSPSVDRFAAESVLFERAISQSPSTLSSHASIFTSLLPGHHGASYARSAPLGDDVPVLAALLGDLGYETVSFNDGGHLASVWRLDRGFDLYETLPGRATSFRMQRTAARFLEWLDARRDPGPFFAFLHTYETHVPYFPKRRLLDMFETGYDGPIPDYLSLDRINELNARFGSLTREDKAHVVATYDADVRSMDEGFAELLSGLVSRGIYEDALVVFLSDHGEELGERDSVGRHSHSLYDELLRVPLVIRFPGGRFRGARIRWQVRLLDVLPTVLDALGSAPPPGIEGASLLPLVQGGEHGHRPAVSQQDVPSSKGPAALRTGDWKYYDRDRGGPALLFDLSADPGERTDLRDALAERAAEMSGRLEAILASRPKDAGGPAVRLSEEAIQQLRSLGYTE